jgi:DNA-binding NarL/FixJ family response regulator
MTRQQPPASVRAILARVIIADDHDLARAGLRNMMESDRGLKLIGEATNGRDAVALCQELRPDLALLDVRMPEMDGLTAAHAIRQTCPQTRVLIMTTHENADYLLAALKAGVAGYVLKDVTRHDLLNTIRRVLRGEAVLSGEIGSRAIQNLTGKPIARLIGSSQEMLTPRELDVLKQVAEGHTNRQIAEKLSLSVGTVKIHVEHIIAKLGVADRTQAAVRAVESGLVRPSAADIDSAL